MLPSRPGVYIFKNGAGQILYIGKAKSLRDRVHSYFQPPVRLGLKTAKLVSRIAALEHIEVQSEIEALLLESRLIKKFQPPFNLISKDDKSPYFIHFSRDKFPHPIVNHESPGASAGPFFSGLVARKILRHFRRIVPYCTAQKPTRPCLYSHLGLCNPCPGGKTANIEVYLKNIQRLKQLLQGRFKKVQIALKKQMREFSQAQNYEAAAGVRNQLAQLSLLLNTPISPDDYLVNPNLTQDLRQEALDSLKVLLGLPVLVRIEMYDIANLSGTAPAGAMAVSLAGEINSRWFRHFTLRSQATPDDPGMLAEVLTRRLKRTDWPMPDLIVLDGGKSQLSIISHMGDIEVVVIALAKQHETIHLVSGRQIHLPKDHPGLRHLMALRDEAHRFSRRLHHHHRAKNLTN